MPAAGFVRELTDSENQYSNDDDDDNNNDERAVVPKNFAAIKPSASADVVRARSIAARASRVAATAAAAADGAAGASSSRRRNDNASGKAESRAMSASKALLANPKHAELVRSTSCRCVWSFFKNYCSSTKKKCVTFCCRLRCTT